MIQTVLEAMPRPTAAPSSPPPVCPSPRTDRPTGPWACGPGGALNQRRELAVAEAPKTDEQGAWG